MTQAVENQISALKARTELSDRLYVLAEAIRPCVAMIWKTPFPKGGHFNRSYICSILATEFLRLGFPEERVSRELIEWNLNNDPPLRNSDLGSTLRTAIRKSYKYGCQNDVLVEYCIDPEICQHARDKAGLKRVNYRAFLKYGWQRILNNLPVMLYWIAIPEVEKRRGMTPGSKLYVTHRELADTAGVSKKHVGKTLTTLSNFGLIEYVAGTPRKWEGKASEVRRIFPVPLPPED